MYNDDYSSSFRIYEEMYVKSIRKYTTCMNEHVQQKYVDKTYKY